MMPENRGGAADAKVAPTVASRSRRLSSFELVNWVAVDGSVIAKAIRFGLVGAVSGIIFGLAAAVLIDGFKISPNISSVVAYIISMPVNFLGNRNFSFRSKGHIWGDALRFSGLHIANMAVTAGAMSTAVEMMKLHYLFGVLGAIVLVPVTNFILMNVWVFGKRASSLGR